MSARGRARTADLSLYLVTDSGLAGGIDRVPGVVAAAVRGGAGTIQVRDKHASDADVAELVRDCRAAVRSALGPRGAERITLFVNDRLAVAEQLGCDLHVGQSDVAAREARAVLGEGLMIGLSASTPDQVRSALEDGIADVLGIGPVRATPTKADAAAPLGLDGLAACLGALPGADPDRPRAVAIGGIDTHLAADVAALGVDGVCVVSAIMAAPDPERAARELTAAIREGRERIERTGDETIDRRTGTSTEERDAPCDRPQH